MSPPMKPDNFVPPTANKDRKMPELAPAALSIHLQPTSKAIKLVDHEQSISPYSLEYDGDEHLFSDSERNELRFINNLSRVQQPHHFQVNYTTYNVWHDQDSMRPGHNCMVMTLSREEGAFVSNMTVPSGQIFLPGAEFIKS
ncbi:hypothetical protein BDR06DRAFT_976412 [Suillus hirtellus]|nr:hypothetical protein BDR06DRAFT_976412 [Suillus hirtellus]